LIAETLHPKNLTKAYTEVLGNRGSAAVDGMSVKYLKNHIDTHRDDIVGEIINDRYIPSAIKGVEIPKSNLL
jgi:RNA-directed DNA polymerase